MARITLLEMLLRAGLITEKQCDDALQNRVFYGGKIGTSLIELGLVTEVELASFLSRKLAVPYIAPEQLKTIPAATIALIPQALALKYHVIPLGLDKKKLTLVMADPADLKAIDEISFATGFIVRPVITPEIRLIEALAFYYGAEVDPRYLQLAKKLEAEKGHEAMRPPRDVPAAAASEPAALPPQKMPEAPGETPPKKIPAEPPPRPKAPAGKSPARSAGRTSPRQTPAPSVSVAHAPVVELPILEIPELENSAFEEPALDLPALEGFLGAVPAEETPGTVTPSPEISMKETAAMDEKDTVNPARKPTEAPASGKAVAEKDLMEAELVEEEWLGRVEKYSVSALSQKLSRVEDREEIGTVLIEYMRSRFERSALFILRGGAAYGWKGTAGGRALPSFGQFRLPLDSPSILKSVAEGEEPHVGAIPETVSNGLLREALGSGKGEAIALPLKASGTTVGIVYVENAGGAIQAELPELRKVIGKAGLAFEILLSREKILMS